MFFVSFMILVTHLWPMYGPVALQVVRSTTMEAFGFGTPQPTFAGVCLPRVWKSLPFPVKIRDASFVTSPGIKKENSSPAMKYHDESMNLRSFPTSESEILDSLDILWIFFEYLWIFVQQRKISEPPWRDILCLRAGRCR